MRLPLPFIEGLFYFFKTCRRFDANPRIVRPSGTKSADWRGRSVQAKERKKKDSLSPRKNRSGKPEKWKKSIYIEWTAFVGIEKKNYWASVRLAYAFLFRGRAYAGYSGQVWCASARY